ncbi:MAG: hypothetical protein R3210_04135, partial [Roseovarius sp.]|nr:hypothetical protein [Roseovarius sp.]
MIVSPSYCAMMARYNKWQNASLVEAADALDDAAPPMPYVDGRMFGIEIIDAALLPAMFVALLAGVISFL